MSQQPHKPLLYNFVYFVITQRTSKPVIIIIIIIIIIYLFTAVGLSPGGSGYFTCKENMKLITTKFKSGWLHAKACSGNLESWEISQHLLIDTGKPRGT